ncbi:hypothetical protein HON36_03245 [Candidatus Parcubacteria bacterium]|nr:hypothetical protein [Candidatus Parcubacteria bacterium]
MRRLGYHPHRNKDSYAKRLSNGEFPRFHVYLNQRDEGLQVSIHLDQKAACYESHTAHSGDYDGELLEQEKQRIISLLNT